MALNMKKLLARLEAYDAHKNPDEPFRDIWYGKGKPPKTWGKFYERMKVNSD